MPRVWRTLTNVEVMDELTVGELSERSGVAISALHFYEKKGLISSRRTSGNQRRYRRDVLRWARLRDIWGDYTEPPQF